MNIAPTGVTIVKFFANWCEPCKKLEPVLESLPEDIVVVRINVEQNYELASEYQVMTLPTLLFFKDGDVRAQLVGLQTRQKILSTIEKL